MEKWLKLEKICQPWKNRSHLKQYVTLRKLGHIKKGVSFGQMRHNWKNVLYTEKCVTLRKVCHTWRNGSDLEKCVTLSTGKNNGFPSLDILGYLKNTHKNPKFGKVRQIPIREFQTKLPNWDLSHSSKFGVFVGTL